MSGFLFVLAFIPGNEANPYAMAGHRHYADSVASTGAKWVRLWGGDGGALWGEIQPTSLDSFEWDAQDDWIRWADSSGFNVMLTIRTGGDSSLGSWVPCRWIDTTYEPGLGPQQIETLIVDDGTPYAQGANGDPTWMEAVQLPVSTDISVMTLIYYPGNAYAANPDLTWYVWDDDGAGSMPGTVLGTAIVTPVYDDWFEVDVSSMGIGVNAGYLYVGWSDENMTPDGDDYYWNYFDSALDGYNYWFDGGAWVYDDFFSGDFLVRAIVEHTGTDETPARKLTVSVYPNPSRGLVNFALADGVAGDVAIYDAAGRAVVKTGFTGKTSLNLDSGVYLYRVNVGGTELSSGRLVIE